MRVEGIGGTGDLWLIASYLLGLAALASVCGAMAGAVGLGGGALLAPAFFALFGALGAPEETRMAAAVGTALAMTAPLSAAALIAQRDAFEPDWTLLKRWGPFLAIGATIGALGAAAAPSWALAMLCGTACFTLGLQIAFWPLGEEAAVDRPSARRQPPVTGDGGLADLVSGALGAVGLGALSAAVGQGGGGFGAAALAGRGLAAPSISVTAAAMGLVTATAGAAVFLIFGLVDGREGAAPFAVGHVDVVAVAAGAPLWMVSAAHGARLAAAAPARPMRLVFALALVVSGLALLRHGLS